MATTTFVDQATPVMAAWLNDVDEATYGMKSSGVLADGTTDDYSALQAIFTAAASGSVVQFPKGASIKISAPIVLTKPVHIKGNGCTITQTGSGNAFTFTTANQTSAAHFLKFDDLTITGNAKASGSKAIEVANNNPFVFIENCQITGWDIGIKLTDSYSSKISNNKITSNNVGIDLLKVVHASVLENNFIDANTTAAVRLNYGGTGISSPTHNLTFIGGAYQNSPIGIWLESAYEPNILNPYFEGNTDCDIKMGAAHGGASAYDKSVKSSIVVNFQSSSPCSTGTYNSNVHIEESVGIRFISAGFYNTGPTQHVYADSYCGGIHIDYWSIAKSAATAWTFPTGVDTFKCSVSKYGIMEIPYDPAAIDSGSSAAQRWRDLNTDTTYFSQRWGDGFSGRSSLITEAHANASDLLFKVKASQGQIRFADSSAVEYFSVDSTNGRMNCYKPITLPVYTVATLPSSGNYSRCFVSDATATTFASIVAGGGANKVPVFYNGTNWIIG